MLEAIWAIVTFPFRVIGSVVSVLGRAAGLVLGFALMAAGVAGCAASWPIIGIPTFVIGLLVTVKAIG